MTGLPDPARGIEDSTGSIDVAETYTNGVSFLQHDNEADTGVP